MKLLTKITSVSIVSLALIGATTAYAGKNRAGGHEERSEKAVWFISKKLDLNESQEQSLSLLRDQMLVAKEAMHGDVLSTQENLRSLISGDTFDQGKALELISEKTASVNAMAPDLVIALGTFMDTLNPEQKAEILEFMDSRKGHRGHGRWKH